MANPQGTQTTILPVPDGQNVFPFLKDYPVNHIAINNQFIGLQNQISSMQNVIGSIQSTGGGGTSTNPIGITVNWAGGTVVTAGTYVLEYTVPYNFNLLSMDYDVGTAGGSFTVEVRNNFTDVGNLTSVLVNGHFKNNLSATGNAAFVKGSQFDIVIANVTGSPTNAILGFNAIPTSTASTSLSDWTTEGGDVLTGEDGTVIQFNV